MLHIGVTIAERYHIVELIGKGGQSLVYLAHDTRLNMQVAIKEVTAPHIQEVMREVYMLKECKHPYIPRIIDILYIDDTTLIIEDYIDGVPLSEIPNNIQISNKQMYSIIYDVLSVLEYLHNHNPRIIYADLKPSNIILTKDMDIYLLDFNSVIYGDSKEIWGTMGYAPPEQLLTGEIDERIDIYAFGKTFFAIYNILHKKMTNGIRNILLKCTSTDREKRYRSISEIKIELETLRKRNLRIRIVNVILIILSLLIIVFLLQIIREYSIDKQSSAQLITDINSDSQEDRINAYKSLISQNPTDIDSILMLLNEYKSDDLLSRSEDGDLKSLIYPNIERLADSDSFNTLAYEIGILYWYYYIDASDSSNIYNIDNIRRAMYWFEQTDSEKAEIYKYVGSLNLYASYNIKEGDESVFADSIVTFEKLLDMTLSEGNNLVGYRSCMLVMSDISRYIKEILRYNTAESVMSIIKRITKYRDNLGSTELDIGRLTEMIDTTESVLDMYKGN